MKELLIEIRKWLIESGTRVCDCQNCKDKRRWVEEIDKVLKEEK